MSERLTVSLATPADDAEVRHLLAANPIPGRIRLRFEREPAYFAGCATMGPFTQTIVARDGDRIVGVACRAVRSMYLNGQPQNIGYLGQLRVHPTYRGRSLVARGFRLLRDLHDDGRARGYVTTIASGSVEAEGVLVRNPRRMMPEYRFVDTLITLTLPVPRSRRQVNPVTASELPAILRFLEREGPNRNFVPVREGLPDETTPGFDPRDLVVVRRNGEIAGVSGLWDQSAFKQTVIDGYDRLVTVARPLYNGAALLRGQPALPPPGSALRLAYGSFFTVAGDDPAVARELIELLLLLASERGFQHLVVGFSSRDPLLSAALAFRHVEYRSGIYSVAWSDEKDFHDRIDSRPTRLELAAL